MESHYFRAQTYTIEFEPAVIEDIRIVVGLGENMRIQIKNNFLH